MTEQAQARVTTVPAIETESMQIAAALIAQGDGWELAGVFPTDHPGICIIKVTIPEGGRERAQEIGDAVRLRREIQVDLWAYEEAFKAIRQQIKRWKYERR